MISIPLFLTPESSCNYLDKRNSQSAFVHPSFHLNTAIYSQLIEQGFRRSGNEVYRPHCINCSECIASRLLVEQFILSRNQKRCLKKNQQTTVIVKPAQFEQAHYHMYMRYQQHKHQQGGMANSTEEEYINFFGSHWCHTLFIEFSIDNELAAIAIVDLLDNALSAVYTFFEPKFSFYSLGTYAVLWQQNHAKALKLDYLYLGFWIKHCQKMSYKTQYQPIQGYINNSWQTIVS
ncbi:MAG: arginyltransferase [Methylococcales symbiont of Hymedesmia sp. n. MRB-2018]|nr:MAG: arginyltransferase [Methylococcales symbiont of Hymedesmia sp. n. MRB-2018]KAF3983054.1 MAG: arginyltransferase [Methylococcales symbiont of Hymedesmia sp. n. MRB-2018]